MIVVADTAPLLHLARIGRLGILAGLRRMGAVVGVAPVIEQLRADGFWMSESLIEVFLESVGEHR